MKSPIQRYLEQLHQRYVDLREGEVASYIPELGKADPEWFGICVATVDGRVYEVGDTRQPFTIQSVSKPFTYGIALEDRGLETVLEKIGVEPTGDAFNSISLDPETGSPMNPMINAGAIAAASLVAGATFEDRLERLLSAYSAFAGRRLSIDEDVYRSEHATGHRNRAIGHMLRNFDILTGDPEPALDLYFRQCSILVDCRDLSLMAATLANGGVHPLTGVSAVAPVFVDRILSVMTTCGMYDSSGEWVYAIGIPAKSGVGGGVLAALPGQIGIGVFSPRLDARGNSVRGVRVCEDLSNDAELHFLRVARSSRSALRARYSLETVRSKRRRSESQRDILRRVGDRVRIFELQGDLLFPQIEAVVRTIVDDSEALDIAVLDLKRATRVAEPSSRVLSELIRNLQECGKQAVLASAPADLRTFLDQEAASDTARVRVFPRLDAALEWCEDTVLAAHDAGHAAAAASPEELELFRGLTPSELEVVEELIDRRHFDAGELIVRAGDPATEVFVIFAGEVSVLASIDGGVEHRLSTLSAGMTLGELAIVDGRPRSADVRADSPVACGVLSLTALDRLGDDHPAIKIMLLQNMLRSAHQLVTQLNREVAALSAE